MLQIRKKGNKNFFYYSGTFAPYTASDLTIIFNGNTGFLRSESGRVIFEVEGWSYTDIRVYDDTASGTEESYPTVVELAQRLIDLGCPAYYNDGDVVISNLISQDLGNSIELGTDGLLFSTGGGGGSISPFIKEGGGDPLPTNDKYTGANNGFGGQETPENPIDMQGILRKRGLDVDNGIEFDEQVLFALANLGHTTIQSKTNNSGTRFYLVPKGTISNADSLASGVKLFSTDYNSDQANYHDYGIWVTQNELIHNSKRAGTFANNLPFVWKYQDTNEILKLQAKANGVMFLGVPNSYQKDWTIFQPFQLGRTTFLVGRDNAPTSEFINNAYYDGSWKRVDTGYSHRFSMSNDGAITFWSGGTGSANSAVSWVKKFIIKQNGTINATGLETYANDSAAGSGGLITGDLYQTSTGELRIKL